MRAMETMYELAVLCDFDGTISQTQTMDFIYQRFAECGMEFARRWERGEISTPEEIRSTFATVTATKKEMEAALLEIDIDPGFKRFLAIARERGYGLAIVSDGLEWYIQFILSQHGITNLQIYANRIKFKEDGFSFEFPWHHPDVPHRGVSKRHVIHLFREQSRRIIYVGDGRSDTDIVDAVDRLYAKGWLADYCRDNQIEAITFTDWHDLIQKWEPS